MRPTISLLALALGTLCAPLTGWADEPVPTSPTPPIAEVSRPQVEAAPVSIKDSRGQRVTLQVPHALHRPANRFRLYGTRPLTLWDAGRRSDLYRDAFLDLATQSSLKAPATTWDTLTKQLDWLTGPGRGLPGMGGAVVSPREPVAAIGDLAQRLAKQPNFGNLQALGRALGEGAANAGTEAVLGQTKEPLVAALQLRAVATDQAEQRLLRLGTLLAEGADVDPAMREGYLKARREFTEVRQGLWPAVGAQVKKNGGRLLFSAAKNLVVSQLGWWALFGELGWRGSEAALGAEYQGQYGIVLATALHRLSAGEVRPEDIPLALYAEYAMTYRLTEALKSGQLFGLTPAGGRSPADWQIRWSTRLGELKSSLAPMP